MSDPEKRFRNATRWGEPPEYRPDLGPCLIYTGADNGNGYGQFRFDGRNGYAHRFAWIRSRGPIPDGLTVDHLCRVRRCCNVDHLELVTAVENHMRAVRARTHCPNGHKYVAPTAGARRLRCRTCQAETWRRSYNKLHARAANGLPDRRVKYDPETLCAAVDKAANDEITTKRAAELIGCTVKYADKRVRARRRDLGLPDRRPKEAS